MLVANSKEKSAPKWKVEEVKILKQLADSHKVVAVADL